MKVVNRDTESIVDGVRRCARQDGPGVGHFSHDTTGVKCADMEVIGAISDFIKRCNIGGKETASPGPIRKIAAVRIALVATECVGARPFHAPAHAVLTWILAQHSELFAQAAERMAGKGAALRASLSCRLSGSIRVAHRAHLRPQAPQLLP